MNDEKEINEIKALIKELHDLHLNTQEYKSVNRLNGSFVIKAISLIVLIFSIFNVYISLNETAGKRPICRHSPRYC